MTLAPPNSFLAKQHAAEDRARLDFVRRLAAAPIALTDYEAHVVSDLVREPRALSNEQRAFVDGLRAKHHGNLK